MKRGFYPRLALDGIRKNRRIYLPYMLTCIGMVAMTYILLFLSVSSEVAAIYGGDTLQTVIRFGFYVLVFFATVFLFYTNSFLIRRRKKEFGLYNILGMGKRNLARILIWETLFTAAISVAVGLACGLALSKLAELGMIRILGGDPGFALSVSPQSLLCTAAVFAGIFLLLLLNSLRQLRFSSAISLLRSENAGERPPRANWFLGLLGIAALGTAYSLAVTIGDPYAAMVVFLFAVLLVIAGTYLVMIAGSVLMCRILQRNRRYYYKPNHFVSVSSMVYRMKRNGAGLASICILVTMVLVTVSSISALFAGVESIIADRYPRQVNLWFHMSENEEMTDSDEALLESTIDSVLAEYGTSKSGLLRYRVTNVSGLLSSGELIYDTDAVTNHGLTAQSDVHEVFLVPVEDYNAIMGTDVSLGGDEVLVYATQDTFHAGTFGFTGKKQYRVREILTDCFIHPDAVTTIVPCLIVIVPDLAEASDGLTDSTGYDRSYAKWYYSFDTGLGSAESAALCDALQEAFRDLQLNGYDSLSYANVESRYYGRQDCYALYGGIFYLGIVLSVVFVFAAVLIMYYKQISEGYEDQPRFEILQKVGMTKKAIRETVNSQLLTMFFLPLLMAGLHLAFAFPIVEKLLRIFYMDDSMLFVCTTAGSFAVFALLYGIVYRITSNAYYRIVSSANHHE